MGKLKTIYLALLNKDKILEKDKIIKTIKEYNKINKINLKNALWYLSRRNYIKRIFLDYYYINSIEEKERDFCNYQDKELLFEVLNKEKIKWYLGLNSALHKLGEIWQVLNVLTIINNRISGENKILGIKVKFIKIKEKLIFGLKRDKTKNGINYFYSDIQKTKLDLAYISKNNKLKSDDKTKQYINKYPKWLQKLI